MHNSNRAMSWIVSVVIAALLVTVTSAAGAEMKMPSTADEYLATAKQYREKAETYRKEANEHREMAAAAKKSHAPSNNEAHGAKNPSVEKMVKHCNAIAAKADALAVANEKAADFYELRAKELKDK